MLLWFADLMNVTEEVTIHRPNVSTLLLQIDTPVTNSNALDEREPATGFAVIPYIQGVTEPIKRILNSHNVKVAQKPFQTLGHIFAKPKDPVKKEQRTEPITLVAAFRSPLLKALDRSVETLGL